MFPRCWPTPFLGVSYTQLRSFSPTRKILTILFSLQMPRSVMPLNSNFQLLPLNILYVYLSSLLAIHTPYDEGNLTFYRPQPEYLQMLSAELANEETQPFIRSAAGIALK